MKSREILKNCFHSTSNLWSSFIEDEGELNTLYYPSAGEDLRPFVFSKTETLKFMGLDMENNNYIEPNFFIFSDYFPFPNSKFFDSKYLHWDNYTSIYIEDYCEIRPSVNYQYDFNEKNVPIKPSQATGKAIYLNLKTQKSQNKKNIHLVLLIILLKLIY